MYIPAALPARDGSRNAPFRLARRIKRFIFTAKNNNIVLQKNGPDIFIGAVFYHRDILKVILKVNHTAVVLIIFTELSLITDTRLDMIGKRG